MGGFGLGQLAVSVSGNWRLVFAFDGEDVIDLDAGWSTAETWLRMQMNWNLWRVRQQAGKLRVKKFPQLEPT